MIFKFRYTRQSGITEPQQLMELRSLYGRYRETGERIQSLERFFDTSIALLKPDGSNLVRNRAGQSNYIQFDRKPTDWSRVAFFAERKRSYYIRLKKEEIYPLLNPKDAILPMKIDAIFPGVKIFTSIEFTEQERKLEKIIRIYHLNEDGQIFCPRDRVYGSFFYDNRPMIYLLINDKKLIFTEQAKFRTGLIFLWFALLHNTLLNTKN